MAPALGADDDMFGPSRCGPPRPDRPKPSMISAKLRAKEERKRVIRICTDKLERIKDPDRNLRRSVCINNTYFRLQDEVRREKRLKRAAPPAPPAVCAPPPAPAPRTARALDSALESIDRELRDIADSAPEPELELPLPLPLQLHLPPPPELPPPAPPSPPPPRARKRPFRELEDGCVAEALRQLCAEPEGRRRRSDFEIILDALRLDDGKGSLLGCPGHDSCGHVAFLGDAPYRALPASLET